MKHCKLKLSSLVNFKGMVLIASTLFLTTMTYAQETLIRWNSAAFASTFGPTVWTPASLNPDLTLSPGFTRGSSIGTSGSAANAAYGGAGGWSSAAGTDANGFTFVITPTAGKTVSLSSISAYLRRSNSGPTSCSVQYSINGGAYVTLGSMTSMSTSTTPTSSPNVISMSSVTALQDVPSGTTVKIRFLPQGSTTGNFYFVSSGTTAAAVSVILSGTITGEPLPITLGNIQATNKGSVNQLNWQSITEVIGDAYQVERSNDGVTFAKLASIEANGKASNYSYTDEAPLAGRNYYRLNLLNNDLTRFYSKVVYANVANIASTLKAYPNPTTDKIFIQLGGLKTTNYTITITDIFGKIVVQNAYNAYSGDGLQLNLSPLATGTYLLKYNDGSNNETLRISKK